MSAQGEFAFGQSGADADLLTRLLEKADRVLVKKLSNNDRNWARYRVDPDTGLFTTPAKALKLI